MTLECPLTVLLRTFCLWTVLGNAGRILPATSFIGVEARTLESWELIVGEWEVSVNVKGALPSRRRRTKASITSCKGIDALFPPRRSVVSRGGGSGGGDSGDFGRRAPPRQRQRKYECRLAMYANQTFVLRPVAGTCDQELGDANSKSSSQEMDAGAILPIRGEWNVLSNPYCVTDRFYDNVRLVSYPRVQWKQRLLRPRWGKGGGGRASASTSDDGVVISSDALRRVRLEFHGHLRGHHTAGGLVRRIVGPERYHRGRIRNGVVLLSDVDDDLIRDSRRGWVEPRQRERLWLPWLLGRKSRKVVVATFTAKRRMLPFRQLIQELDDVHLTSFELYRYN